MKDLPHHIKKLNRNIIRSTAREQSSEEQYDMQHRGEDRKQTMQQVKKQAKERLRQERESRAISSPSPEERNKQMKHRVPVFDRTNNAKPMGAKPSHKKTPPL